MRLYNFLCPHHLVIFLWIKKKKIVARWNLCNLIRFDPVSFRLVNSLPWYIGSAVKKSGFKIFLLKMLFFIHVNYCICRNRLWVRDRGLWCFNNISAILWQSVLLVEETVVPGENHWTVVSHWQTLWNRLYDFVWKLIFFNTFFQKKLI